MKYVFELILFTLLSQVTHAAEAVNEQLVTATKFNIEAEGEYKPWSLNMGISNIDTQTASFRKATGKGVTINLQREVVEQFEVGVAFTNYTLDVKPEGTYNSFYTSSQNHTNFIDVYAEFKPIQLEIYENYFFEAAVNAGLNYETEANQSPVFYGIGASLDFNRQIGIRADMKTYLSKANVNTMSLVGYF